LLARRFAVRYSSAAPPSLHQGFGGQATRRASEKVGSNIPLSAEKEKRKNFKELSFVRLRH